MTSRVLDSGPGANQWQTLTSQRTLPTGSGIAFETRSGGTSRPDAELVGVAAGRRRRRDRKPGGALHPVPRDLTSSTFATPTLERVQITYGAGKRRTAAAGHRGNRAERSEDEPDRRPPRRAASRMQTATR